jgi:hypothetical protein
MKRLRLRGAIVMALLVAACNRMPAYQVRALPSGRAVKVISTGQINFPNVGPAWILKYLTDMNAHDRAALRREADEIWLEFKPDVEKAGMNNAILSANSIKPGIFQSGEANIFVFTRDSAGNWKCLTDP